LSLAFSPATAAATPAREAAEEIKEGGQSKQGDLE